jgi:hypothetical protein
MRGESMGLLFERIVKSHWNINVEHQLRNRQREALEKEQREREQGQDVMANKSAVGRKPSFKTKVGQLFGRSWQ